jgi:four helix bundle protein
LRDFTHKLSISLKEADETLYWLNMLRESHKISDEKFVELRKACVSIFLMLRSAVNTSRKKINRRSHHYSAA